MTLGVHAYPGVTPNGPASGGFVQLHPMPADNDPMDEPDAGTNDMDFAAMEREIESLLSGQPEAETPPQAAPQASVRDAALEAEPLDPLIKEIDAALADDADALLKGANGDIGEALRSVFDERALSGQEEEINRALIEAFGSSRVAAPAFVTPQITNPLPGFEGSARQIAVDLPREEPMQAAESAVPAPDASVSPIPAAEAEAVVQATPVVESKSVAEPAPEPAPQTKPDSMKQDRSTTVEAKPDATTATTEAPRGRGSLLVLPMRVLSAPMRSMPETGRVILSIAAITLALWTPVAWWLAHRSTQTPAVAPIVIKPAPVVAHAEPAKSDGGGSGH